MDVRSKSRKAGLDARVACDAPGLIAAIPVNFRNAEFRNDFGQHVFGFASKKLKSAAQTLVEVHQCVMQPNARRRADGPFAGAFVIENIDRENFPGM